MSRQSYLCQLLVQRLRQGYLEPHRFLSHPTARLQRYKRNGYELLFSFNVAYWCRVWQGLQIFRVEVKRLSGHAQSLVDVSSTADAARKVRKVDANTATALLSQYSRIPNRFILRTTKFLLA